MSYCNAQRALDLLKNTVIEPTLRPSSNGLRSLIDFVDEQGMLDLTQAVHDAIADVGSFQGASKASLQKLETRLEHVSTSLHEVTSAAEKRHEEPVDTALHSLEDAATDMAELLQSLVKHYDLCTVALKHIEGGGDAADEAGAGIVEQAGHDTAVYSNPISDAELDDMIQVLENDAREVDDVVQEIHDYADAAEDSHATITMYLRESQHTRTVLEDISGQLITLDGDLPKYSASSTEARNRWLEARDDMDARRADLEIMTQFFEKFHTAHAALRDEAARRTHVEARTANIVSEAMAKLSTVYESEYSSRL